MGNLMTKKMSSKSQYIPDLGIGAVSPGFNSQTGESYKIAELGSEDEHYTNLGKYDVEHPPLNKEIALIAIRRFLDQIGPCYFLDENEALENMDKTKSIGFGAKLCGIFSRNDPKMKTYLLNYLEASEKQVYQVVITASQKDEVRVSTKTPRLFTSFPPEHTLLCTVVLGDFFRQFLDHRFTIDGTPSAVGDPMQSGAMAEYYYQLKKRKYPYNSDTSAQDSSVSTEFLELVYDEIKTKFDLDEEQNRQFEAVRHNSIYKYININGDIYLVPRGLGSGDYLTIIINIIWRYYMILENYKYPLKDFEKHNTVVINGDDLIMSSDYDDLDLNSRHATIKWKGTYSEWDEMDFCSMKFEPFIHHDPVKVKAVLDLRRKRKHMFEPSCELQRLAGLLRTLSTKDLYLEIEQRMQDIVIEDPDLLDDYLSLHIDYETLFNNYNNNFEFT
jgi:hypothetical protein